MSYVRKTANPNMGWSTERRAKYSKQCKEAHANGTRHKISKKAVSLAISKGKKEAIKRKNRSEGQKRRRQETLQHQSSLNVNTLKGILATPLPANTPKMEDQIKFEKVLEVERVEQFEREDALWELEIATIKDIRILFNLIEEHFGFQPSLNQFMEDAIGDKVASITAELCKKLQG